MLEEVGGLLLLGGGAQRELGGYLAFSSNIIAIFTRIDSKAGIKQIFHNLQEIFYGVCFRRRPAIWHMHIQLGVMPV